MPGDRHVARIIVLDGPEKAGKSTLAAAIVREAQSRGMTAGTRHWGRLEDSPTADAVYADALKDDLDGEHDLVVWDRSWASEAVYGTIFDRERRLARDWFLGEWLYGRAVQTIGARVMVLGPSSEELQRRRDESNDPDDLPVAPYLERESFKAYASTFDWVTVMHVYDRSRTARMLLELVLLKSATDPRDACGPPLAPVVFLGERPSSGPPPPGAWLPFSTRYTERFGRAINELALRCAWTNMSVEPEELVSSAKLVVACGHLAGEYARLLKLKDVLYVPHPAALYRWGRYYDSIPAVEDRVRRAVVDALAPAVAGWPQPAVV